jgi:copper chaperone CopZ
MTEHRFQVPGIAGQQSEWALKSELLKVTGVWNVEVNQETKTVVVSHDAVVDTSAMRRAINDAGYEIEG